VNSETLRNDECLVRTTEEETFTLRNFVTLCVSCVLKRSFLLSPSLSFEQMPHVIIYRKATCEYRHSLFYIVLKNEIPGRDIPDRHSFHLKLNSGIKIVSFHVTENVPSRLHLQKHELDRDLSKNYEHYENLI